MDLLSNARTALRKDNIQTGQALATFLHSARAAAIPLSAFLDRVASLLRGLPERVWIEATVLDVRASAAGHTLELTDPALERGRATLRVFLSTGTLATIRRDLDVPIDPALLVGMTTCLLIKPDFSRRWHLGGRVEALSRDAAASLRARLLERIVAVLKREKLWDRQHTLPRPRDVTRLAVVHPAGAAGWGDIAGELGRWERAGLMAVRSCPAAFEGDGAATAIVAALRCAATSLDGHRPDLVLVVRGGGARGSLGVLDEEAVARGILGCPVPVLCGTGHAQDRTLADQVAWRAVDTPSKALAVVAATVAGAARGAEADWAVIQAGSRAAVLTHVRALETRGEQLKAGAARGSVEAAAALAKSWSAVLVATTAARERCGRWQVEAAGRLADVLARAPRAVEAQDGPLLQLIRVGLARASAATVHHTGGLTLLAQIEARAIALLERDGDALQRQLAAVLRDAQLNLSEAAAAMARLDAAVTASDLEELLQRGLVMVTDAAGRLLPRRAAAMGQTRLELHFADGPLTAHPAEVVGPGRC